MMRNRAGGFFLVVLSGLALMLSGCVVRTYPLTRDRVDQDVSSSTGNRGYLMGSGPVGGVEKERPKTRTTQVVEIELHSPIKFDNRKPRAGAAKEVETKEVEGDEDYRALRSTGSAASGYGSYTGFGTGQKTVSVTPVTYRQYTVQKGDTLQKISNKFYGTTRKWRKIYEANKTKLKSPDRVMPGHVLDIPDAAMQESAENLK